MSEKRLYFLNNDNVYVLFLIIITSTEQVATNISTDHPSTLDWHGSKVRRRAANSSTDPTHTGHKLLRLVPAGGAIYSLKPVATETVSWWFVSLL